jgi:hypothetical protein
MKRVAIAGALLLGLATILPIGALHAQELTTTEQGGEVLGVKTPLVAPVTKRVEGPHFRFDENLVVTENLAGDVYAAGSTVRIEGKIDGDLLVAGGTVIINGDVTEDLRVAGGNVTINGNVGKNVSVGGGNVMFGPTSKVGGSLLGGAGTLDFAGQVAGNAWIGAGETVLKGKINQDAHVSAETASFNADSVVGGNLQARLNEGKLLVDKGAVAGKKDITFVKPEVNNQERALRKNQKFGQAVTAAVVTKWLFGLLIGFVSGSVLLHFFRKTANNLSAQIKTAAVGSLGWGLIALVTVPFIAILLMITVLGLPLGFMTFLGYILAFIVAKWIAAYALGQWVETRSSMESLKNPYLQFAVGLLIINLLALIPVAGWLVSFGATLMGLGALFVALKTEMSTKTAKK